MLDPGDSLSTLRLKLRRGGYYPLPLEGKRPALKEWEKKFDTSDDEIRLWSKTWHLAHNTGVLAKNAPGMDIDIMIEPAAEAVEMLAREHFEERGDIHVRIGLPPKRLIPLRTDEPFSKLYRVFTARDGTEQKIEILGNGQQYVVDGIHPLTHKPYGWHGGDLVTAPRESLPYVRREDVEKFLDAATKLLTEEFGFMLKGASGDNRDPPDPGEEPQASPDLIAAALAVIPNNADWDQWNAIGMALWRATGGSARGFELFDAWSQKSPKYNTRTTAEKWAAFFKSPPTHIGAGTIFYLADQASPTWRQEYEERKGKEQPKPDGGLGEWNAALDINAPPPRGWLLGNTFCRTFLSSILGSGGVGKTALRYAQALSLATGRALTREHIFQRCHVLIVSLEDDANELRRRIRAACLHYNIPLSELDGWLWLAAPGKTAGKLMEMDKKGRAAVVGQLAANLEAAIVAHSIDLVMLDPFVKSHSVEENLNSAIDDVAQILTDLATKHNIAVDAPHHVRKGQMTPGDAEAGRGASSLIAAARLVYTCLPMSEEEAQSFGISQEDRRDYIRVDSGKVNIAKASRNAKWFHLVSVQLDNANLNRLYPSGDEVQTIEPWEPPKTWADLSNDDLDLILTKIECGLTDGNLYSDANSATTRAAWKVVQKVKSKKPEAQCREVIRTWVKNGVLVKTPYTNPKNRKEESGLKLSPEKREEMDNRDRVRRRKEEAARRATGGAAPDAPPETSDKPPD